MSSGLELQYVELRKGVWYYVIEDSFAPKCSWDWREFATAWGPFSSEELTHEHYRANHGNTGGCQRIMLGEGVLELDLTTDKVLQELIRTAHVPQAARYS